MIEVMVVLQRTFTPITKITNYLLTPFKGRRVFLSYQSSPEARLGDLKNLSSPFKEM